MFFQPLEAFKKLDPVSILHFFAKRLNMGFRDVRSMPIRVKEKLFTFEWVNYKKENPDIEDNL